jgi:hypothetical protein
MLHAASGLCSSQKNGLVDCTAVKTWSLTGIISFRDISQYEHVFGSYKATEVHVKAWENAPNAHISVWEPV